MPHDDPHFPEGLPEATSTDERHADHGADCTDTPPSAPRFAGVPESTVRSVLRYAGREGLSVDSVHARFGDHAQGVLAELVSRGLIASTPHRDRYAHTLRGREWIATPTEKLYRLPSAQRAVVALITKVRTLAARRDALFVPERVLLFGEILTSPATLRSVDVGIDMAQASDAQERAERGAAEETRRDRRKTTPVEWLAARERGAWAYLAGRSPLLRLLPLSGDHWPQGIEVYPTNDSPSILTGKRRPTP